MVTVVFVFSANGPLGIAPFVEGLGEQLESMDVRILYFGIKGNGWKSYLKEALRLKKYLRSVHCDIIHGHYIWSILVGALQAKKYIKIGSYIGSDLNTIQQRRVASFLVTPLLDGVIVMNEEMANTINDKKNILISPYGVDIGVFSQSQPIANSLHPRVKPNCINILFSSRFDRLVKDVTLARKACTETGIEINLIELKDLSRNEIVELLNQVNLLLMTSKYEGSPQVIKEAMACNAPIVSVDVGDVRWLLKGVKGCYIASHDPVDIASKIKMAVDFGGKTNGRERLIELGLDSESVARRIFKFYKSVMGLG